MARMNITLPAMGEGIIEATINKWLVSEGTAVREDDPLVEVATDKVDSEVPAPVEGVIVSLLAAEGSVVRVGETIAVIEISSVPGPGEPEKIEKEVQRIRETIEEVKKEKKELEVVSHNLKSRTPSGKFISPLVRSIAAREGISHGDLDRINGTGMDGRITRDDVLRFLNDRTKDADAVKAVKAVKAIKEEGNISKKDSVSKSPAGFADSLPSIWCFRRRHQRMLHHLLMLMSQGWSTGEMESKTSSWQLKDRNLL
jgi:2-oxoglutarate dehydrogenase E2 component (dihydrolipoamide succinyltransferase)